MDFGPTPEQLEREVYEPPHRSQTTNRTAYRRKTAFERMQNLEPEHREAAKKLDRHYHGAAGCDVRMDDAPRSDSPPDEFAIHRHATEMALAEKAVGSPLVWCALMAMVEETTTPEGIGRTRYTNRSQAKAHGDGLILAGLDTLAAHWGLIRKPDG